MAVDYEKGAPRNLVQFSEYNDLAFTDTGVNINDNARPNRNTLWSSEKIESRIREMMGSPQQKRNFQMEGPARMMPQPMQSMVGPDAMGDEDEFYPNGYRRYMDGRGNNHHMFRVLRPSWWLSWIIPSRQHYCDKCCNYMQHTWSTSWNDDPKLASCNCSKGCGPPPQRRTKCSR